MKLPVKVRVPEVETNVPELTIRLLRLTGLLVKLSELLPSFVKSKVDVRELDKVI